eukprot:3452226-Rhodomonas_salina.1
MQSPRISQDEAALARRMGEHELWVRKESRLRVCAGRASRPHQTAETAAQHCSLCTPSTLDPQPEISSYVATSTC